MEADKVAVVVKAPEGGRGAREVGNVYLDVRPRLVWGRRPRPNGGRRRPRGRYGFEKHAPVVSRGSYPISTKPLLTAPRLDEFPLVPLSTSPPTGNKIVDEKLKSLSIVYGGIARIRIFICARAELMMTCGVYLAETHSHWKKHDNLLGIAEALRKELLEVHGVEAPAVPAHFYGKF